MGQEIIVICKNNKWIIIIVYKMVKLVQQLIKMLIKNIIILHNNIYILNIKTEHIKDNKVLQGKKNNETICYINKIIKIFCFFS